MHLFLLQIPPRENWFQYVRRVYATTINFPCIITLNEAVKTIQNSKIMNIRQYKFRTIVSEVSSFVGNPEQQKIYLF